MNPTFSSPTNQSLVSAIMDDRIRETAEIRLAAEAPVTDIENPHRFRRFLINPATRSPRARSAAAASPSR